MATYLIITLFTCLIVGCTKKELEFSDELPFLYGVAYDRIDKQIGVCYPVPINIAMYFLYRLWRQLQMPRFITDYINMRREAAK